MDDISREIVKDIIASDGFRDFIATYKVGMSALLIIATIINVVMIVFQIVKLIKNADNDSERKNAITGLGICMFCFVVLTSLDLIYGLIISLIV